MVSVSRTRLRRTNEGRTSLMSVTGTLARELLLFSRRSGTS